MMMRYGRETHGVTHFIAKISTRNAPSIKMFEKMGYTRLREIEAFEEVHYVFCA
jgi:RimJ/RimL family protein N-acetyltransferase